MWIVRRRWELLLIGIGIALLGVGLDLPPPVGRTIETNGKVSHLIVTTGGMTFSLGGKTFTASNAEPGWRKLRSNLRDGLSGRVVGWTRFFDSDGPAGIVEFET